MAAAFFLVEHDYPTLSDGLPKTPVRVVASLVSTGRANVTFTDKELDALSLGPGTLGTFALTRDHIAAMATQTIGHTDLESHPLIPVNRGRIVAQPTALGAAIRRHAIEAAHAAGALDRLAAAVEHDQLQHLLHFMLPTLNITVVREPEDAGGGIRDIIGRFDEGGYVHVLYVADALGDVRADGLLSVHHLFGILDKRVAAVAEECAAKEDYQRGLTLIVHGGVGRGFAAGFGNPPARWQRVAFSHAELARLSWDHGFDALRIWKITEQEDAVTARGYLLDNINGFPNLYGFMFHQDMALISEAASPGMLSLGTDFVTSVRHRLRAALDSHVVLSADRTRWVEVQRAATEVYFHEARDLPIYVSRGDMAANGTFLSCVETAERPWWVEYRRDAKTAQGRTIGFHLWETAQNWLLRAVSRFEVAFPALPDGPLGFRVVAPQADDYDPATAFGDTKVELPKVKIEGPLTLPTIARHR